jgi:glycosyltransferase involved in cell wall biosynthesis
MGERVQLSVVVITFNEERNIARCIDSVLPVADEVVVVDSLSTDRTREICLERGVTFIEQPFLGYVEQKNFALDQAANDHVLALDADECLSEPLRDRVSGIKTNWVADGYTMNRFNNYYGKWIRHSAVYPDRKLRLWDRRRGRWGGTNPHDRVEMQDGARVEHLDVDLLHYAYDSIDSHARQANHFSNVAAKAYRDAGRTSNLVKVVLNPTFRFVRDYFLKLGFLDGFYGLTICSINAYMTFLKYAKLRDLQKPSSDVPSTGSEKG